MRPRNPVLPPDRYFPDGEPHFINGELYVYPSCDRDPGSYCSDQLYVPHSRDLSEWAVDGPVFACAALDWETVVSYPPGLMEADSYDELPAYIREMLPKWIMRVLPFRLFKRIVIRRVTGSACDPDSRKLYAPDSLTVGGRSYLFFCTSDGLEGVAASCSPSGPFTDPVEITFDRSGRPVTGIDPAVFRDDDGKTYLYWGQINSCGAELTDDMTKVREDTLVNGLLTEKEHGFHEGSSMRKINGIYYYIFADSHRGKPSALGYATSESPLGPFRYQGIIIDNDGCDPETWNNHGSIECVNGRWYVFYHRSTGRSRYMRRMCAEPISVDENGRIPEVPVTSIGIGEPYKAGEPLYGYQACRVSNAWIDGDRLIAGKGGAEAVYRYLDRSLRHFSSIRYEGTGKASLRYRVDEKGELTIRIETNDQAEIKHFIIEP